MTLVDRFVRRQFTAAMALAMVLAMLLSGTALAQTPSAVDIGPACDGAPDAGFPDISGNTHEEAINCIAWYEITKGTNSGDYEPTEGVTRWQMALFIFRTAEYMDQFIDKDLPAPSDQGFNDIGGQSQEAQDAINVLAEIDVVKGKNSTTYAPSPVVRRDQMASFINRLQEWATGSTHEGPGEADAAAYGYPDVPRDNVHGTNIEDLTSAGIVQGYNDGTYKPARGVHRDEMASFIARDLAVNVNNGTIEPKDGDAPIEEPEQPANAELNVTPTSAVTLDADESREYTVTGLTGDSYRITLVNTDNYSVDGDGNAVFVDADDSGTADAGDLEADITSVNGEDTGADDTTDVQTVPDPDDATDVVAPDADGEITFTVTGDGVSESLVPVVYVNGGDSTFLEVDDDGLPTEDFGVGGQITFEGEAVAGDVTLDSDQAQAGGTVNGTVTNPGTVESIAVTGCGFANDDIELDGDGAFTLTLPSEQEPGSCELTFTVLRTDGSSTSTTIPFAVTAAPQSFTEAPDLVSATANSADGTVVYTFDEAANGVAPAVANFRIYDAAGNSVNPTNVEVSGTDPTKVIADYDTLTPDVDEATLATIRDGAVQDAAGNEAYASAAALTAQNFVAGTTSAPDLQTVDNIRTLGGQIVADFRFDEAIQTIDPAGAAVDIDAVVPGTTGTTDFQLITADGTVYTSTVVNNVSADDRTLTIAFGGAPLTLPASQVTRGVALADAVADDDTVPNTNPQETEPRTGTPPFSTGATADRTDAPDLVSVKAVGEDTIAFEFDEAVCAVGAAAPCADPLGPSFNIYDSSATETDGVTATRSGVNANVVNVTFPAGTVGSAVGASADGQVVAPAAGPAVTAVGDADTNLTHELPLADVSFSAGRTALPDLVSVDISLDAFGDAEVVFTFDDDVPATVAPADFALVDSQGTRFTPGAAGEIDEDGAGTDTITFDDAEFGNSEAAAAVIGSVQDEDGAIGVPANNDITEGDVTVSRDTAMTP